MKKIILAALAVASFSAAQAQDLTSKKGEPYLPETGDWAIGVDATPFLQYVGNMFNGNGFNNAPTFGFVNGQNTIIGKYFVSETKAYRGILRVGINSQAFTNPVIDDVSAAVPPAFTEDEMKQSNTFIGLGAGIEFRRGKTRLQGYYGGQAMLMFASSRNSFTYGNNFSATNPTPTTTTNFGTGASAPVGARLTEQKFGSTFGIGARAFAGVEYFILPKISLGGEFGWGLSFVSTGSGEDTNEAWNGAGVVTTTTETGKNRNFSIDTDNRTMGAGFGGQILVNFHF